MIPQVRNQRREETGAGETRSASTPHNHGWPPHHCISSGRILSAGIALRWSRTAHAALGRIPALEPRAHPVEPREQHSFLEVRVVELVANLPLELLGNPDLLTQRGPARVVLH